MKNSLRLAALFALLFNIFSALSLPIQKPLKCNGHEELCDRGYGNTTFLGSHDSFSISDNPWILARNQEVTLKRQLELGVRMLQVQAHMNGKDLHFCHTSCFLFDGGTVRDYLKKVKSFLLQNPWDVVTIIIANPEEISSGFFEAPLRESGIAELVYSPPQPLMKRDDWPTLGEMITTDKRVVIFMDKGFSPVISSSHTTRQSRLTPTGGGHIIPQFAVMWEDPYDPDDSNFTCRVDRTEGPLKPNQQLSLINHNLNINLLPIGHGLRIPNYFFAHVTNRASSIIEHAGHCSRFVGGRNPNFILLDWVDIGQGALAVDVLNGVN